MTITPEARRNLHAVIDHAINLGATVEVSILPGFKNEHRLVRTAINIPELLGLVSHQNSVDFLYSSHVELRLLDRVSGPHREKTKAPLPRGTANVQAESRAAGL